MGAASPLLLLLLLPGRNALKAAGVDVVGVDQVRHELLMDVNRLRLSEEIRKIVGSFPPLNDKLSLCDAITNSMKKRSLIDYI